MHKRQIHWCFFIKQINTQFQKSRVKKLDKFLLSGWNRIFINGYTDEMDEEDYNLTLSKKRSGEVRQYINQKKFPDSLVTEKYFGEAMPFADNETEDGRAFKSPH
jgi:outer membrane protein OmpA-like peptidoglycan-associated protein